MSSCVLRKSFGELFSPQLNDTNLHGEMGNCHTRFLTCISQVSQWFITIALDLSPEGIRCKSKKVRVRTLPPFPA